VTAACVTGVDPGKIRRLPDTEGMKNQVVVQVSHRHGYDHAIRMVGVKMIEVTTRAELEAAVGDRVAMFAFLGEAADGGEIPLSDMVEVGRARGIPTFVDAAAERPDVPNRYLSEGADVVAYSGGKCLRGPQSSGFVIGRRDLLDAAFANAPPHHSLGRPMKAGKEEIMGLLAAVEQWVVRDHEAEWLQWERRLSVIETAVKRVETVTTRIEQPGRSNVAPVLAIAWDPEAVGVSPEDVRRRLSSGDPRIELATHGAGVSVMPYMMEPGEDAIVAARLTEALSMTKAA
jgi:L-seryl-tRNA(Ser) seleniumtransferase